MKTAIIFFIILTCIYCDQTDIKTTATQDRNPVVINPNYDPAPDGSYMTFNGTNQFASVSHNTLLNFTNAMTIEAWVVFNSISTNQQLVGKWGPSADQSEYRLRLAAEATPLLSFEVGDGTNTYDVSTTFPSGITIGTWLHIAGVFNNGTMDLYINGTRVATNTISATTLNNSSYSLNIAQVYSSAFLLNGSLDEIRIWNYNRTPEEIAFYYNKKATYTETGLVAYYEFDDAAGSTTVSETINGLDASTSNNPPFIMW